MVLAGVGIVLVIGWYASSDKASEPAKDPNKVVSPTVPAGAKPAATQPASQQGATTPPTTTPAPATKPNPTPTQTAPAPTGTTSSADDALIREARQRINRTSGGAGTKMVLYYVDGLTQQRTLQPVEMVVPTEVARIKSTVEHLIQAPTDLKLTSQFPAGTVVRETNLRRDGVAVVSVSKELASVRGSAATLAIQYALVYSLTEIEGVKSVLLWIEGNPAQLDQLIWDKPIGRDQLAKQNVYTIAPLIKYQGP